MLPFSSGIQILSQRSVTVIKKTNSELRFVSSTVCRELSRSKSSRLDSHQRHGTFGEEKPGLDALSDKASAAASSLIQIFRKTSQKVLSTCLRGLQKGHGDLFHGSKRFLSDILLRPSAAAVTEADKQWASCSDAKEVASLEGSCVAAQVLQSVPNAHQWIKETISSQQQGTCCFC